jgi:serpin B
LTATEIALVGAGNSFAFDLLREVSAGEDPDRNLFLSPLSASIALGMTLNGARGETFDAMRTTLGFGGVEQGEINRSYRTLLGLLLDLDPAVSVGIANSVWYHEELSPTEDFRAALKDGFESKFAALDFGDERSVSIINDWVRAATKGRIPKILDQVSPLELMYLINAIHFKAPWTQRFEKKHTAPGTFFLADGSSRTVPLMSMQEAEIRWVDTPELTIADIPYARDAFSMTILLPRRGRSVNDLIAGLDAERWGEWMARLGAKRQGHLSLPKFEIEYETSLKDALSAMGMGIAFGAGADFGKIFENVAVSISRVVQKTFVQVDEEGTEAAAATMVGIRTISLPPGVYVDRPFVFAIRERHSGTILFIGRVMDPAAG